MRIRALSNQVLKKISTNKLKSLSTTFNLEMNTSKEKKEWTTPSPRVKLVTLESQISIK